MGTPLWVQSDPRYRRPKLSINLDSRVTRSEVNIFGRLEDSSGSWWDLEVWLEVDDEPVSLLPQTRGGDYWFRLRPSFGFHKVRTACYFEDDEFRSEERRVLSLSGLSTSADPWVEKIMLDEVEEKARRVLRNIYKEIEFERGAIVGRTLTRGWTKHDIDIKIIEPVGVEKDDFLPLMDRLNLESSKKVGYFVDIVLERDGEAFGHEAGKYDLSGITEVREVLMEKGNFLEDPEPEIKTYEGEGGAIYEEGEELKEREIEGLKDE